VEVSCKWKKKCHEGKKNLMTNIYIERKVTAEDTPKELSENASKNQDQPRPTKET